MLSGPTVLNEREYKLNGHSLDMYNGAACPDDPIENVEVPEECSKCIFRDECDPVYEPDGGCFEPTRETEI